MSIKISRAKKIARIGNCPGSFMAMVEAIPASAIKALNSQQIAELVDAAWQLAGASKAIAASDAISQGGIWDHRNKRFLELRAAY